MTSTSKNTLFPKYGIYFLFAAAFLLRLITAAFCRGFEADNNCFAAWANRIYELGPTRFYSPEVFTDYPPGYMYLLYPIGTLYTKTGISYLGSAHLILLRLPSILCDLIAAALLFCESKKHLRAQQQVCLAARSFFPYMVCTLYLFNPAVILNSSVWGQVDSVFTLALFIMCLSLMNGRMLPAYITFGIGLFIKPQALLFAPIIFLGFLDQVILKDFSWKKLGIHLGQILGTVLGMVLLSVPFGLANVWKQYFSTVTSYPYASVNAYNLWAFFGKNWASQEDLFLGLPLRIWSWILILLSVAVTFVLSFRKKKDTSKYPFLSAFLLISIFVFSVRMHERYLYPVMLFLLLAYIRQPEKPLLFSYLGFSFLHFCNVWHILYAYNPQSYDAKAPAILLVSGGMLLMTFSFYQLTYRLFFRERIKEATAPKSGSKDSHLMQAVQEKLHRRPLFIPRPSAKPVRFKCADWICVLTITVIYSCFALYDLGDRQAPATTYDMTTEQSITLDFDGRVPASVDYYIAPWHNRTFLLEEKHPEDAEWLTNSEISFESVFTWQNCILQLNSSQIRLTLTETQASLLELTFLDADGSPLIPKNAADYPTLFDEVSLRPARSNFRNSMYFDEIYHARTAYEFLHGLDSYENTHPPLGKIFIALGAAIFGMNPFGWRIVGTLFGIAMVPFSYLFAKHLTRNTPVSALACVLFAFDFMHFTQTRIATIDVYITFFVILMYYFMHQYISMSFYDTPLSKTLLPLGACGVCMGLGIACKWTGVYAGMGLALLFFAALYRRFKEYHYAKKQPEGVSNGIPHSHIIRSFPVYTGKTILFCLVFFVAVPVLIYLLSYIPFKDYSEDGLLLRMLHNQETMFSYHSALDATHYFSSAWYEWPILKRPIWYFSSIVTGSSGNGGLRESISAFGNPLVWWIGIPAFLHMLFRMATKKDRTAAFLTVGYLAQYLPWFFVTRITFIYHYFPSVIFIVLMIAHSIACQKRKLTKKSFILICSLYGAAVFFLFLLFYPVLSGQPVEAAFVDKWLRWFDSWVLAAR